MRSGPSVDPAVPATARSMPILVTLGYSVAEVTHATLAVTVASRWPRWGRTRSSMWCTAPRSHRNGSSAARLGARAFAGSDCAARLQSPLLDRTGRRLLRLTACHGDARHTRTAATRTSSYRQHNRAGCSQSSSARCWPAAAVPTPQVQEAPSTTRAQSLGVQSAQTPVRTTSTRSARKPPRSANRVSAVGSKGPSRSSTRPHTRQTVC